MRTVLFNKQKSVVQKIFDYCDLYVKSKCSSLSNYNSICNISTSSSTFALPPGSTMYIFDRKTKLLQRERALNSPDVKLYDYIKDEIGYRLSDRIFDIKKTFKKALDLGCGRGYVSKHILRENIEELILADMSSTALKQAETTEGLKVETQVIDEEELVLEPNSLDLVISCLSLHWVNDLPGCFKSINNCLKEDGVFLAAIFGGDTLYELRGSLQLAELEREGGVSPHISPFTEIRDIGTLLTRANFTMLTIDTDEIVIGYPSMFELMWDLKGMGENNAAINRKLHLKRDTLMAAAAIYNELYGKTKEDGTSYVPATFQIIFMLGWKPHPSQPKPLERGSGQISLKDLHNLDKIIKDSTKVKVDKDQ
ncbi:hypothetical protein KPH14_005342 [Odynerus spinipes]|uniref:Arginine-hydroxylase NDUFAF5, mitochondrial n=1 Tax=Odynerus spinipes TaxID=1348599 RepID=A0AAD9RCV2_9HYME|nr:hypothetical protein KPH14_005342 [Odynerus spinipes]